MGRSTAPCSTWFRGRPPCGRSSSSISSVATASATCSRGNCPAPPAERSMPDWFFTSDLHGQTSLYEQLLATVAAHRPGAVIIGGDLCPHQTGDDGLRMQRVFLQGFMVEFARRLHEANATTE